MPKYCKVTIDKMRFKCQKTILVNYSRFRFETNCLIQYRDRPRPRRHRGSAVLALASVNRPNLPRIDQGFDQKIASKINVDLVCECAVSVLRVCCVNLVCNVSSHDKFE